MFIVVYYIIAVSLISAIVTMLDKRAAKKQRWRTKESTLLILSVLGGSVAMFVTMRLIRHKTKRKKFMIGIPIIIFSQIAVIGWLFWQGIIS